MKFHFREMMYLFKQDRYARKKIKAFLVLGCSFSLIIILFIGAVGIYFMKPLLGFLFANIPVLNELLFTYTRSLVLPYLQEDVIGMFSELINFTNVEELKTIVHNYFEYLRTEKNVGFDNFISFTNKIENILLDGKITQGELDLLRQSVVK